MKFRTDFVTNSSSSSYVAFSIKDKALYDRLLEHGLHIEDTEDGVLRSKMSYALPSGLGFDMKELYDVSGHFNSDISPKDELSPWLMDFMNGMLQMNLYGELEENADEDEDVEELYEEAVGEVSACMDSLPASDCEIEEGYIESNYGEEGEINHLAYAEIHNGRRLNINSSGYPTVKKDTCSGHEFVLCGEDDVFPARDEMVGLIVQQGGTVAENVSVHTYYLVCSNVDSKKPAMQTARELCVPIISKEAFLAIFSPESIERQYHEDDAWKLTCIGGLYTHFSKTGEGEVSVQEWIDGHWVPVRR